MPDTLSVQQLYDSHAKPLQLSWISGQQQNPSIIDIVNNQADGALLIGYLNLVRPYRIQVLGMKELDYFSKLGKNSRQCAA